MNGTEHFAAGETAMDTAEHWTREYLESAGGSDALRIADTFYARAQAHFAAAQALAVAWPAPSGGETERAWRKIAAVPPPPPPPIRHEAGVYGPDEPAGAASFGWWCEACDASGSGFATLKEANTAAEEHDRLNEAAK